MSEIKKEIYFLAKIIKSSLKLIEGYIVNANFWLMGVAHPINPPCTFAVRCGHKIAKRKGKTQLIQNTMIYTSKSVRAIHVST
jgi:hypothetical protein